LVEIHHFVRFLSLPFSSFSLTCSLPLIFSDTPFIPFLSLIVRTSATSRTRPSTSWTVCFGSPFPPLFASLCSLRSTQLTFLYSLSNRYDHQERVTAKEAQSHPYFGSFLLSLLFPLLLPSPSRPLSSSLSLTFIIIYHLSSMPQNPYEQQQQTWRSRLTSTDFRALCIILGPRVWAGTRRAACLAVR